MNASSDNSPSPNNRRQAGIQFILLTLFIDILGIGIIIPVLPQLIREFAGGSISGAAWYVGIIGGIYSLMQFICAPILGALSDRFGRRPILLGSLFGFGIDFIVQGCAPNITWLFFGRLLAGVLGSSITTCNAYVADVSTPETRARNFGLVGVMFGLGFICGPALGGVLGGISLRLPFFVAAGLALLNWLYGYFVLPESLPPEKRSSFTFAKANPFGTLRRLRKYPIVSGLAAAFVCMSLAQRGLENVWVLHGTYRYDWSILTNGLTLVLVGLMATIVQGGLIRPTIKRLGERGAVLLGLSITATAFLGYGLASQGWMIPILIIFGSLGGIAGPAIQSIVTGSVGATEHGKIQGSLTSLISLTNIAAPLLFSTVLFGYFTCETPVYWTIPYLNLEINRPSYHLPGAPFFVGSALLVAAVVIVRRVFNRIPAEA